LGYAGHSKSDGTTLTFKPADWQGKDLALLQDIDVGDQLSTGRWRMLLFRRDCSACSRALRTFERQERDMRLSGIDLRSAIVEVPQSGAPASPSPLASSHCLQGRLLNAKGWIITTPLIVELENARLVSIEDDLRHPNSKPGDE